MRPPWFIVGRTAKLPSRRRPVNSALGLAGANAWAQGACSSLRSRSQTAGGRVPRQRRSSSRSTRSGSGASRPARPAFVVVAHSSRLGAAPLTDGLIRLASAVQAAQEGGSGAVANAEQAQLFARPNRSFNRRRHGRLPCLRGAVCLSCSARARRPTASPRLPLR